MKHLFEKHSKKNKFVISNWQYIREIFPLTGESGDIYGQPVILESKITNLGKNLKKKPKTASYSCFPKKPDF